jgi:threonine synthase
MKHRGRRVKYISTRGHAPVQGFEDVLLAGLATDGGLYLPQTWPQFPREQIVELAGLPYPELALRVILPFVGDDLEADELQDMLNDAYSSFSHKAIAPLVQLDSNDFLLELFHGPTLAFKDFAMQLLARLMDRALARRGRRATIVGATSGDTGGAAIEAFRGRDNIDVFILHPHNRVTEVQRRQMTTPTENNVHNIALEGNFDDCQALLKALFNDHQLRGDLQLAGVNSINWARIMGQIPYYFSAATSLGAPQREVAFCVPSGNLGDIFAGFVAAKLGLPVGKLVIATNVNDILARTLETGRYETRQAVATDSPSMDIQVSSNFERLLFELSGRDSDWLKEFMDDFANTGVGVLRTDVHEKFQQIFAAHRLDDEQTGKVIDRVKQESEYIADPHTAVGLGVGALMRAQGVVLPSTPLVTLSTAHPAKFPDAVERATGVQPFQPEMIVSQKDLPERFEVLANDFELVADHIKSRARAYSAS